jgi:hypothetical protein
MKQYGQVHNITDLKELYATIHSKYQSKIAKVLRLSHISDEKEFKD